MYRDLKGTVHGSVYVFIESDTIGGKAVPYFFYRGNLKIQLAETGIGPAIADFPQFSAFRPEELDILSFRKLQIAQPLFVPNRLEFLHPAAQRFRLLPVSELQRVIVAHAQKLDQVSPGEAELLTHAEDIPVKVHHLICVLHIEGCVSDVHRSDRINRQRLRAFTARQNALKASQLSASKNSSQRFQHVVCHFLGRAACPIFTDRIGKVLRPDPA